LREASNEEVKEFKRMIKKRVKKNAANLWLHFLCHANIIINLL
jgi:hypothetical protein